ncbi:hypothetical protein Pint_19709 [Pistacia integerrima]|uniref:Uncharacterized protein n=1 Tax=Pistacia integerrima TaxID=434235 RepID=A0ACC0X8S7_9ROSI|nr:hypothetical protein Pint_19709 [Pistacia integerrima]
MALHLFISIPTPSLLFCFIFDILTDEYLFHPSQACMLFRFIQERERERERERMHIRIVCSVRDEVIHLH